MSLSSGNGDPARLVAQIRLGKPAGKGAVDRQRQTVVTAYLKSEQLPLFAVPSGDAHRAGGSFDFSLTLSSPWLALNLIQNLNPAAVVSN